MTSNSNQGHANKANENANCCSTNHMTSREICSHKNFFLTSPKNAQKNTKYKSQAGICVTQTRFAVIEKVARQIEWNVVSEKDLWNVFWSDSTQSVGFCKSMKRYQKVNHFPGMEEICRKNLLARNLTRMQKKFPFDYNIFPKTWCFPADLGDAIAYSRQNKKTFFILKPDQGAQGRGIILTKSLDEIKKTDHMICQVYIQEPLLVDGFKFDLRIYALLTSVSPLTVYIYNEGLARFATRKYKAPCELNSGDLFMHLTNYSLNKRSNTYSKDSEAGSKRKISTLNRILRSAGVDVNELWNKIDDVIVKTVICAWSILKHNYLACFHCHDITDACFEVLGFDVLVDSNLKPYVLEVNHSPSFHIVEEIDRDVKEALIRDTLNMLNISNLDMRKILIEDKIRVEARLVKNLTLSTQLSNSAPPKFGKSIEFQSQQIYDNNHLGTFRQVLPITTERNKYEKYLDKNLSSIYADTLLSQRRKEAARQFRRKLNEDSIELPQLKLTPLLKVKNKSKNIIAKRRNVYKQIDFNKWIGDNWIPEVEYQELLHFAAQREETVLRSGIVEQVYKSLFDNNLLSESDKTLYNELIATNVSTKL